ncbi:MAG TPA: DinB family protein [Acidobacteriaceae bacterium]|nr:DinB family protein [Acidobacteriaceae bacterium]
MRIRLMAVCCVLGMLPLAITAQTGAGAAGAETGKAASPSKAFDGELSLIEREMMSAVKAMPSEKFGFAPKAEIFVPGQKTEFATVRTFAQQAAHVAQVNYSLYSAASGLKPEADVAGIEKLTNKEDVVAALAGSFAFGHRAIATMTSANAFELVKSPELRMPTRATVVAFGIAHGFDHYGQMVEYLRMNGIVPPASAR